MSELEEMMGRKPREDLDYSDSQTKPKKKRQRKPKASDRPEKGEMVKKEDRWEESKSEYPKWEAPKTSDSFVLSDQWNRKEDWGRKESWDWTHFFTLPLNFSAFQGQFENFISTVNATFGTEYKDNFQGVCIVHLSLVQMKLNATRRERLRETMPKIHKKIVERFGGQTNRFDFNGLGMFSFGSGAGILYLDIQNNEFVDRLNLFLNDLCEILLADGVIDSSDLRTSHIEKKNGVYTMGQYHVTLMKSSFAKGPKKVNKDLKPVLEKLKNFQWDSVDVQTIDVSIRGEYTADKYYLPLQSFKL